SGLQFAYLTDGVESVLSKGAKDARTPKEALDNLLRGTGLKYEFINEHTIAISAQQPKPVKKTSQLSEVTPQTSLVSEPVDAAPEKKKKFEMIVVTGSNIPRAGFETSSPVQVIDRESMIGDGAKTLSDIAIKLPINV